MLANRKKEKCGAPPRGKKGHIRRGLGLGAHTKTSMGRHCEICGTHEFDCKDPAVHWPKDAEGQRRAREVRKRWREQKLKQGADAEAASEEPLAKERKEGRRNLRRSDEECKFAADVVEVSEKLTGHVFSRMEWEGRAVDRPAVVWMHGDFEGGRTYEVQMPCSAVVQMRVERASGPVPMKRKASEEPA